MLKVLNTFTWEAHCGCVLCRRIASLKTHKVLRHHTVPSCVATAPGMHAWLCLHMLVPTKSAAHLLSGHAGAPATEISSNGSIYSATDSIVADDVAGGSSSDTTDWSNEALSVVVVGASGMPLCPPGSPCCLFVADGATRRGLNPSCCKLTHAA